MSSRKLLQQALDLMLVVLLLAGCGQMAVEPTPISTPTLAPLTVAPTSLPPTAIPAQVPGISGPLTTEGIQLQLSSVTRQNTYNVGTQGFRPNSAQDDCLIVEAQLLSGDPDKINNWKVAVTDEAGRESSLAFASTKTFTSPQSNKSPTRLWLFVVTKASKSFVLHLPDGQAIELNALLSGPSAVPSGQTTSRVWQGLPVMPLAMDAEGVEDMYIYTVVATRETVQDYYQQEMSKLGWGLLESDTAQNNLMSTYQKGDQVVGVGLEIQGDKTRVTIFRLVP